MSLRFASSLALLSLFVVACGDDGSPTTDGGPGPTDGGGTDAPRADSGPGPTDGGGTDAPSATDGGPTAGETGDPCTMDEDCVAPNTLCLQDAEGSGWDVFPGGYCTHGSCTFGDACGMNGTCAPLPGRGPHCFLNCTADTDCRDGYTCQDSTFVTDARFCLPPMT